MRRVHSRRESRASPSTSLIEWTSRIGPKREIFVKPAEIHRYPILKPGHDPTKGFAWGHQDSKK
jgi:hypothetical protein